MCVHTCSLFILCFISDLLVSPLITYCGYRVSLCIFIKTILVNTESLVKMAQCFDVTPEIKVAALFARKCSLVDTQGA